MVRAVSGKQTRELTLLDLLRVLWRHRLLVAVILLLGCGLTTGIAALLPAVYEARVLLLIDPDRSRGGDPAPISGGALDNAFIESQLRVLTSRALVRATVVNLALHEDPEFATPLAAPGPLFAALRAGLARAREKTSPNGVADGQEDPIERLVDRFLERLAVTREGRSYVIAVAFRAHDAAKAARIANAIAEQYQLAQLESKAEAAKRNRAWLNERLAALKAQHEADLAAMAEFRARHLPNGTIDLRREAERIAQLERDLIALAAEREAKEARLKRLRELMRKGEPLPALDELASSAFLQNLAALKAQTLRREAELKAHYGDKHPKILDVRRERAELEARIEYEQASLLREQEAAVQTLRSREQTLLREIERLKARVLDAERTARELAALEQRADASRRNYESYLALVERIAQSEAVHRPDARVISEAVPPDAPVFPRINLAFSVSATVSLLIATVAVYLREIGARGLRSVSDVHDTLGVATVAVLPRLIGRSQPAPERMVLERPDSRFTESVRSILASLLASRRPTEGLVVMIASALAGEGKTTFALALGRLAAREGLKTLLVDADVHRPAANARLGAPPRPGLAQVLRGEARLDAALGVDPESGLVVLPGTADANRPTRLLGAEGLGRLLGSARARFDLVLVDTPALLAYADARLIAPSVDCVILVLRWKTTERDTIAAALSRAPELAPKLFGAVLNQADPTKRARELT